MNCPQCGTEIRGRTLFCPNCGRRLARAGGTAQQEPPDSAQMVSPVHEEAEGRGCAQSLTVLIIALVVILSILGLGVAGVYYGMQDRARVEHQAAEEHYEKGSSYLARGELELAIAELELAMQLNPKHKEASAKLEKAGRALQVKPTATPVLREETHAAYLEELRAAYEQRDWQQVFELADRLLAADPTYHRSEVDEMLFQAFYHSGLQFVEQGRLREAVRLFDRALALQPDSAEVTAEKNLAVLYLKGMGYWGADWAVALESLAALYRLAPDYRDVGERTHEAYASYGDVLGQRGDWCEAVEQYAQALEIMPSPTLTAKRQDAAERCERGPVETSEGATITPGQEATLAPSGTFVGRVVERTDLDLNKLFIRGKILDKDGKGVLGVRVQIKAWNWWVTALSDGNGQFAFDGLADPVTYTLSLLNLSSVPVDAAGVWGKITWVNFEEAE